MSRRGLFVTGGTGLVGRSVLARLSGLSGDGEVFALARRPPPEGAPGVTWLRGELADVERHAGALARCDRVLHLAARTGKARPAELERTNVDGTRALLRAAAAAGVRGFVHVSTIAAGFPEKRHYPYAASKERAEELVRASGLAHVVARPTIVLGADAPAWRSIAGLAGLPLVPLPGGGRARVQPIDKDDLAALLLGLVREPELDGSTIELGGPEATSFRDLLARVHRGLRGRAPRFLPLPLAPAILALALLEGPLSSVLPATAGQLYAFRHDSLARPHPFVARAGLAPLGVDAMIARYLPARHLPEEERG